MKTDKKAFKVRLLRILLLGMMALSWAQISSTAAEDGCWRQKYSTSSIVGSDQLFELEVCESGVKIMLVSSAEEASKIGLLPGAIIFNGNYNEEIPGLEGKLTLPGMCGLLEQDTQADFTGEWMTGEGGQGINFGFQLPTYDSTCQENGINLYSASFSLYRIDSSIQNRDNGGKILPAEGCETYKIYEGKEFISEINLCNKEKLEAKFLNVPTKMAVNGVVDSSVFFYGNLYDLDGSIEGTGHVYSKNCDAVGYRLTGQGNEPELAPMIFLEGYRPNIDAQCAVTQYSYVRFRLEQP